MKTITTNHSEVSAVKHIFGDFYTEIDKEFTKSAMVCIEFLGPGQFKLLDINESQEGSVSFKEFVKEVSAKSRGIATSSLVVQKDVTLEDAKTLNELILKKEGIMNQLIPIQHEINKIIEKHKDIDIKLSKHELEMLRKYDGDVEEFMLICVAKRSKND